MAHNFKVLMRIVDECLGEAEGYPEMVFPALGTGILGYPQDAVADAMFDAFVDYTMRNPLTSIKDITVIVFPTDKVILQVSF